MLVKMGRGLSPLSRPRVAVFSLISALPSDFTYTRADIVATYRDSSGKLRIAALNAPRFDHDASGNPLGLRLEGQTQNKLTVFNAVPTSTSGYTASGTVTLSAVTDATALAAAGLDQVVTSKVIQAAGGASGGTVTLSGTTGDTNNHSYSVHARITAGSSAALTNSSSGANSTAISGSTWQRYKLENQTVSGSGVQLVINVPAGVTILFILAQMEENPFCTSTIITSGAAATRAQDVCYIDNINTKSYWNESAGGIGVRYIPLADGASAYRYMFASSDGINSNEVLGLRVDQTGYDLKADVRHGGTSLASNDAGTKHSANILTFAGITWKNGAETILGQGVANAVTYSGGPSGATRLNIGMRNNGSNPLYGWIQEIRINRRYLAPGQLAALGQHGGDTVIVAGGQSLAKGHFFSQSTLLDTGRQTFISTINAARPADAATMTDGSTGSTAAARTSVDPATNYWWDLAAGARGIPFNSFYSNLAASGVMPTMILWAQGEEDANAIPSETTQAQYKAAVLAIFNDMRANLGPLPVFIQRLGVRDVFPNTGGMQAVREVQQQLINENPSWIFAAAEIYDVPLIDGLHPTSVGYGMIAQRAARKMLKYLGASITGVDGPSVTNATRSGTSVTVTLTHDAGTDFTPTSGIKGFHFFDNASEISITAAVRTNATTITLTLASAPTSGLETLYYIYDADIGIDKTKIVMDNAAVPMPLRTAKLSLAAPAPGFVLAEDGSKILNEDATKISTE